MASAVKFRCFIVLVSLEATILSCKPFGRSGSETELGSLDHVGGDHAFGINQCGSQGRSQDIKYEAIDAGDLDPEVRAALVAVPTAIRNTFFEDFKGQIVVSDAEAKAACPKTLEGYEKEFVQEHGQNAFAVCLVPKNSTYTLLIEANKNAIRHSLVRVMSYVYSGIVLDRLARVESTAPEVISARDASLKSERDYLSALAHTFLNELGDAAYATDLRAYSQADPQGFARHIFADALDSYFCKLETFNTFAAKYPKTFEVFTSDKMAKQKYGPHAQAFSLRFHTPWFADL